MSRVPTPDLTRLAILAQTRTGDLKPVLLKVQAMTFAAEDTHSAAAVETFETLALGLIPFVTPPVAEQVRAILAGAADVPPAVLDLLIRQGHNGLGRDGLGRDGAERARALSPPAGPDTAERIRLLVGSARHRPALARELLARPDLTIFNRALLYRHADDAARDALREDLAERLAARAPGEPKPLSAADRSLLLVVAEAAGFTAALAQAARFLRLATVPDWRAHRPLDVEFFALSLVALGLTKEEVARCLLTVDAAISHSVRAVFRLYAVARSTPPAVAAHLVACELGVAEDAVREGRAEVDRGRDGLGVATRVGSLRPEAGTAPRVPAAADAGRPGYRSRSTTGRDRS